MFIILPIGVDYQARKWPVVTFTLMGINTLVHLASMVMWFNNQELYEWWMHTFWLIPSASLWHTYFTSMFVHADIFHLLGNMVYLFLFGSCVEDLIGRGRFLAFFLVAGVVAAFGHVALTPGHFASEIPMGGASGAISACMGGFVLLLHRTRIEFKYLVWFFFRLFNGEFFLPAWLVISFWFGLDVLGGVLDYAQESGLSGTAFGAHIGGFLLGMAGIAGLKPVLRREEQRENEPVVEEPEEKPAADEMVSPIPLDAQIYLYDNGAQSGPFALAQVWQQVQEGTVSSTASYWHEGLPEWRPLRDVM